MGLYSKIKFRYMGDRGVLLEFGDDISPEVNGKVRKMALAIREEKIKGIIEAVPTYCSLLIVYDSLILPVGKLRERLEGLEEELARFSFPEGKLTWIPAVYGGPFGPDLEGVAEYLRITPEEVVRLHCSRPYLIYMIGFMPGFPYMGELPETLVTPRLRTPRLSVPAGSVAIAQRQTGIYPVQSPGGWKIIGRTPVKLFNPEKDPPALLQMGDYVEFYPITEKEFEEWPSESSFQLDTL